MGQVLKEFVTKIKNSRTDQIFLAIKKRKLKEFDLNVDDLLDASLKKKLKKFEDGD